MEQNLIWKEITYKNIHKGYLISQYGYIKHESLSDEQSIKKWYHSSNGYDYVMLINNDLKTQLYAIDELLASAFIDIPEGLLNKLIKVNHIDNNPHNVSLYNLEWVEDVEEWQDVTLPGIEPNRYQVSNMGNLRHKKNHKLLKCYMSNGYIRCTLKKSEGVRCTCGVHRLVAHEFCHRDIDISGNTVNHIDGVKSNNRPKNLEVVTYQENSRHAIMTGLSKVVYGEKAPHAKITDEHVRIICDLLVKFKGSTTSVMKELKCTGLDIPRTTVNNIKYKSGWTDISDEFFTYKDCTKSRITENDVKTICELLVKNEGAVQRVIKALYEQGIDIPEYVIKDIKNKRAWTQISDQYFNKDQMRRQLSIDDVIKIRKCIKEHENCDNCVELVVNELGEMIPLLNEKKVRSIKNNRHFKHIG